MAAKQDPTLPTFEKLLDGDPNVQSMLSERWGRVFPEKFSDVGMMAHAIAGHFERKNILRCREGKISTFRSESYLHLYLVRKMMRDNIARVEVWVGGSWQVWTRSMFEGLELTMDSVRDRVKTMAIRANRLNREAYYLAALTWMRKNPAEVPKVLAMTASLWRRTETEVLNDLEELASSVTSI